MKMGESPGSVASEDVRNWGCDAAMGRRPPLVKTSEVKRLFVVCGERFVILDLSCESRGTHNEYGPADERHHLDHEDMEGPEAAPVVGGTTNTAARLKLDENVLIRQIWPVKSSNIVNLLEPPPQILRE
jgi:hypothetical protein